MATTFRIPKLTDREIIAALGRVRTALKAQRDFRLVANITHQGEVELHEKKPENNAALKFVFEADSQVISNFRLIDAAGSQTVLAVRRNWEEITDSTTIEDSWTNAFQSDQSLRSLLPQLYVSLLSLARRELKASDVEAALKGHENDAWNRYRDAQLAVVNSLQQATESLIIKAAEKNAEIDKARSERFEKAEADLRAQVENERKTFQSEYEKKVSDLEVREQTLADQQAAFNTKEAGYVARKKMEEQIEQIKTWLDDWKLTRGTTSKRLPIAIAYISAIVATAFLTAYATHNSYQLLKTADDIAKLLWWQWLAIWAKSFFPLAAFMTFVIYFIRWSSTWAQQHAEEEFRNRTLLIDIGRSSWLLEAVRNAQQSKNEIPTELLRELSRNLFAIPTASEGDIHPTAVSDMLLQGLSSVRIKAPDGSEVEAIRDKAAKAK